MPKLPNKPLDEKTRRYLDNSNDVRRKRYEADPDYRRERQAAARERQKKLRGSALPAVSCSPNLSKLDSIGRVREVQGSPAPILTFTYEEMAEAMGGYTACCFRRWVTEGRFPDGAYQESRHSKTGPAPKLYSVEHVVRLIRVMSKHQETRRNLCAQDTETIQALFSC